MRMKQTAAAAITALALLGLSACGGEQSVEEACKIAQSTVESAETDIQSSMSDPTNLEGVTEGLKKASDAVGDAEDKVTNKEVKTALDEFGNALDSFTDLFDGVKDPTELADKTDEMNKVSADISASSEKLSSLCKA